MLPVRSRDGGGLSVPSVSAVRGDSLRTTARYRGGG